MEILRPEAQHFHTKLICQRSVLIQIEWVGVQNGPIIKNTVLPQLATLFFLLVRVWEPLKTSWFDVAIFQMSIFILFVSAWVLYESVYSLWVSLILW